MFFCKEMRAHHKNARADKDRFSDKPTLSVQPGFSEKQPTLSADC